ncbi:MAG TPA: aminopeptidase [Candidatus Acidoferrum sp.]|nr:aminopeptidase [Candidatus Acidoferrum sp.]
MKQCSESVRRRRQWLLLPCLLLVVIVVSGCHTFAFYGQAIKGQYQIVASERQIKKLIADPQTPAQLKSRLQLIEELRAFAAKDLKLPVDGHYEKYADLRRRYVVWNVQAAPEFSLQPKTWWYPFVGSVEYRGYFSEGGAQDYAAGMRKKSYDVYVDGVEAYSTLGWFRDPVLNTFISNAPPDLAETLFHELGHQRLFAPGDTDFNEAFATSVGQEGARRWLRAKGDQAAYDRYQAELRRSQQFVGLVQSARKRLAGIYGDERTDTGQLKASRKPPSVPPEELRRRKQQVFEEMRADYAQLKAQWGGNRDYEGWFARAINNAQLNSVAAYFDLVPCFEQLLAQNGGDLEKFYQACSRLAKEPQDERHRRLLALRPGALAAAGSGAEASE